VLDINMPGTNGLGLLKQVKARHPDVPVIVRFLTRYLGISSCTEVRSFHRRSSLK
jgi:DNA-binding NtrC family response regulator